MSFEDMMQELRETEWYRSRPDIIKQAIEKWPVNSVVLMPNDDRLFYLIGYSETSVSEITGDLDDVALIVSPVNPLVDYLGARSKQLVICSKHLTLRK